MQVHANFKTKAWNLCHLDCFFEHLQEEKRCRAVADHKAVHQRRYLHINRLWTNGRTSDLNLKVRDNFPGGGGGGGQGGGENEWTLAGDQRIKQRKKIAFLHNWGCLCAFVFANATYISTIQKNSRYVFVLLWTNLRKEVCIHRFRLKSLQNLYTQSSIFW